METDYLAMDNADDVRLSATLQIALQHGGLPLV